MTLKCLYLRELEEMVREADNDNDGLINCQGDNHLGTGDVSKTDEFSEKFQTAFDPPPPSFSENYVADFLKSCTALKTIYVVYF